MGHWYAAYDTDLPGTPPDTSASRDDSRAMGQYNWREWRKRRYPPYLTTTEPGPLDYAQVTIGNETQQQHSFQLQLSVVDQIRLGILENKQLPDKPGANAAYMQHEHDREQRYQALMGLAPRWRIALGFVLPYLANGARLAASALTVLYWATRRTTTGIDICGTRMIVAGEILRNVVGAWDYYYFTLSRKVFWVVIWAVFFLPEVLQLRLVIPYTVTRKGSPWRHGSWRVLRALQTARERRSARLGQTSLNLLFLAAIVTSAAYWSYNYPVKLLNASHDQASYMDTYPWQYPGSRILDRYSVHHVHKLSYWGNAFKNDRDAFRSNPFKYRKYMFRKPNDGPIWRMFMFVPLSQGLISAGQLAQLCLNFRSKSFAGNYALTCAFKVAALLGLAAPFIAQNAYNNGLFLTAAAQATLVLAEAAQAWMYPRVEQEIDGEGMEL